jgi:hypothetical protein
MMALVRPARAESADTAVPDPIWKGGVVIVQRTESMHEKVVVVPRKPDRQVTFGLAVHRPLLPD